MSRKEGGHVRILLNEVQLRIGRRVCQPFDRQMAMEETLMKEQESEHHRRDIVVPTLLPTEASLISWPLHSDHVLRYFLENKAVAKTPFTPA